MQHPQPLDDAAPDDPATCTLNLAELRPSLLRYARARLRNGCLAEDAVSETVLAALQAQPRFATQTQATSWVYGILRHKLIDQLRHQGRETPAGDGMPEPSTRSPDWFVGGAWCGVSMAYPEPDVACQHGQLVKVVLRCCELLPSQQRQAFLLREVLEAEPVQICAQMGITEGHLWVLVHRARVRLRKLLREGWSSLPQSTGDHGVPLRVASGLPGQFEDEDGTPARIVAQ